MPTHPPRSQPYRKQESLDKRVSELQHAIAQNAGDEKLAKLAAKVKEAHLNLYKGKIEQFRYSPKSQKNKPGSKAERDLAEWSAKSTEEILEFYQSDA